MTYSTEDLLRMENLFGDEPDRGLAQLDCTLDECLIFENIQVWSLDDTYKETYRKIAIPKRHPIENGISLEGRLDTVAEKYAENDWKIPSMPMYFAILHKMWDRSSNTGGAEKVEVDKVMQNYSSSFNMRSRTCFNTIINHDEGSLIHYPDVGDLSDDFNEIKGNAGKRELYVVLPFPQENLGSTTSSGNTRLCIGLTGLSPMDMGGLHRAFKMNMAHMNTARYQGTTRKPENTGKVLPMLTSQGEVMKITATGAINMPLRYPLFKVLEE